MIGTLEELIETALKQLTDLGLSDGTLKSYVQGHFTPLKICIIQNTAWSWRGIIYWG